MTKNSLSKEDLKTFSLVIKQTSVLFLSILVILFAVAFYKGWDSFSSILIGIFVSFILSTINLIMIGASFYQLTAEKNKKKLIFLPVLSFLVLICVAFIFKDDVFLLLGFALGLSSPLLFGFIWSILQ